MNSCITRPPSAAVTKSTSPRYVSQRAAAEVAAAAREEGAAANGEDAVGDADAVYSETRSKQKNDSRIHALSRRASIGSAWAGAQSARMRMSANDSG